RGLGGGEKGRPEPILFHGGPAGLRPIREVPRRAPARLRSRALRRGAAGQIDRPHAAGAASLVRRLAAGPVSGRAPLAAGRRKIGTRRSLARRGVRGAGGAAGYVNGAARRALRRYRAGARAYRLRGLPSAHYLAVRR